MTKDLNDSLDALFAGDTGPVRTARPLRGDAVPYKTAEERFEEGCPKCNGRGRFISYAGRDCGECFACKGAGKRVFKSSAADRAKSREQAAARRVRSEEETLAAFAAEHKAEHAWLITTAPRWDVARDLLASVVKFGSLTEKQMGLIRNGIARDEARTSQRAARAADAPAVDASAIEQAFETARQRAAVSNQLGVYTKPLKLTADGVSVKVQPGSIGSQWEGQLFFKSLDGERKLGFVKGGRFIRQFACTDAEEAAVLKCAAEPKDALIAYAKAWSKCGVCNRTLLNKESIERGIGPICLAKFGW